MEEIKERVREERLEVIIAEMEQRAGLTRRKAPVPEVHITENGNVKVFYFGDIVCLRIDYDRKKVDVVSAKRVRGALERKYIIGDYQNPDNASQEHTQIYSERIVRLANHLSKRFDVSVVEGDLDVSGDVGLVEVGEE